MSIGLDLDWTGSGLRRILLNLDWIRTVIRFKKLGSGPALDFINGKEMRYFCCVWQFPFKEEKQHTFTTILREDWLIGSVHGTHKLTIKKLRPACVARPAQFITTGLHSLMVLLIQR